MTWRSNLRVWVVVSIVLTVSISQSLAKVIYVDAHAPGLNNGSSWTDAYNYLQDALADANTSDKPVEIHVAQGVYTPDSNSADPNGSGDRAATFRLINGLSLRGGYVGFGEPDPNARDIGLYETVLSGDLAGNDVFVSDMYLLYTDPCRSENSFHVVTGSETDKTAFLGGFTICGGNTESRGGGIYNYEGDPTITNCTFNANSFAAMFNYRSAPVLIGCRFIRNADGGIRNNESDSVIENCVFQANGGYGIYNENSNSTVNNCIFIGNRGFKGGGIWNNSGNSIVNGCLFTGNRVARDGGAIFNEDNLRISNCAFFGNSGEPGGGISNRGYSRINNCTFVGNRGGGICNQGFTQASNCILWGNLWGNTPIQLFPNNDELLIATYSNVQDGWPGEGNMDIDPCFVELGYWDDPCNTPYEDRDDIWIEGDYHLKSQAGRWDSNSESWVKDYVSSPCIDAGNPGCPEANEPAPNGNRRNMGAYGGTAEASKSPTYWRSIADMTNDWIVDSNDLKVFADYWLQTGDCIPSDFNRSLFVDFNDFAIFGGHWQEEGPGPITSYQIGN